MTHNLYIKESTYKTQDVVDMEHTVEYITEMNII